jgi:cell division protein FtsB
MSIMLDIQQKRKFRNIIYHRVTLAMLFLLVLLVLHSTWRVYVKKRESISLMNASTARLSELESRNDELDQKIKKLQTVSGVEEEIRAKFSVAKESENMVIIVREEKATSSQQNKSAGFWSNIKTLFR